TPKKESSLTALFPSPPALRGRGQGEGDSGTANHPSPPAKPGGEGEEGPTGSYITLKNPINEERTSMRRTVLAGLLDVTAENLKHTPTVKVVEGEIGRA